MYTGMMELWKSFRNNHLTVPEAITILKHRCCFPIELRQHRDKTGIQPEELQDLFVKIHVKIPVHESSLREQTSTI
jgi:hypothetical protein